MTPMNPPRQPDVDRVMTAPDDRVTSSAAMRYTGWFLIYLALAPPIAVILWRVATMPWG
jgi:hypothetical protein